MCPLLLYNYNLLYIYSVLICQCTLYNGCAGCQCIEDRWHRPQNSNKMQLILIFSSPNLMMVSTTWWKCYYLGQSININFLTSTQQDSSHQRRCPRGGQHPHPSRMGQVSSGRKKKKVLALNQLFFTTTQHALYHSLNPQYLVLKWPFLKASHFGCQSFRFVKTKTCGDNLHWLRLTSSLWQVQEAKWYTSRPRHSLAENGWKGSRSTSFQHFP